MDYQEIINAIGSVGFPIIACIGIFSLYNQTIRELVNTLNIVTNTLDNVNETLDNINHKLDRMELKNE